MEQGPPKKQWIVVADRGGDSSIPMFATVCSNDSKTYIASTYGEAIKGATDMCRKYNWPFLIFESRSYVYMKTPPVEIEEIK